MRQGAEARSQPAPGLPAAERLELPLLQELAATGGSDEGAALGRRLVAYFPQLEVEALAAPSAERRRWHRLLRRAARRLEDRGELRRDGRALALTERGRHRLEAEALRPAPPDEAAAAGHRSVQEQLRELGALLGKHAELEHDGYDVVWRERRRAPRLSHVFEVQVRGSVDSALLRLKRAHEAQRSRLFLVVADERSARFATDRLRRAFPELQEHLTLLGTGEVARLHAALRDHGELVAALLGPLGT